MYLGIIDSGEVRAIMRGIVFHKHILLFYNIYFRSLNAFLNTGKGGTVYLGIIDSGEVRGLKLTQFQVP